MHPILPLALVVCLASSAAAQTRQQVWDRCRDRDNPDLAIGACTALIQSGTETDADLSVVFVNRGIAFADKNEAERALKDYDVAIRLDGTNATAYYNRGAVYVDTGDYERAIAEGDRALRARPSYVLANAIRAEVSRRRGQFADAAAGFDKVFSAPIGDTRLEQRLRALRASNEQAKRCGDADPDLSIGACTGIIKDVSMTKPALAGAFNRRGVAQGRAENDLAAFDDYSEAIRLDPSIATFFSNRGLVSVWLARYEQAAKDFDRALAIDPRHTTAMNGKGLLARQQGDYASAVKEFTAALAGLAAVDTASVVTYRGNRGIAYFLQERYDLALADLNAALAINPKYAHALFTRGVLKRRTGDSAGGDADIQAAKTSEPKIEAIMAIRSVKR